MEDVRKGQCHINGIGSSSSYCSEMLMIVPEIVLRSCIVSNFDKEGYGIFSLHIVSDFSLGLVHGRRVQDLSHTVITVLGLSNAGQEGHNFTSFCAVIILE